VKVSGRRSADHEGVGKAVAEPEPQADGTGVPTEHEAGVSVGAGVATGPKPGMYQAAVDCPSRPV